MKKTLRMPKLGANDETVQIDKWLVCDKDHVTVGQAIVVVETSKTSVDVEAQYSGYIRISSYEGDELAVGQEFASLFENIGDVTQSSISEQSSGTTIKAGSNLLLSDEARRLVEQSGMEVGSLSGLVSSRVIRENAFLNDADTLEIHKNSEREIFPNFNCEGLTAAKKTEVKRLSQSSANQYSSSLTIHVESLKIREKLKYIVGINENISAFVMSTYVKLLTNNPKFTAYYHQGKINYYHKINLGVLVDFGKGLNVLVIKEADKLSSLQLHEKIVSGVCKYHEDALTTEDVSYSTTTVSDLSGDNVYSFQPLINYKQSTILAIGGDSTLELSPLTFTLVFDHRVLTGRDVSVFLREFKSALLLQKKEKPLTVARRSKV
jgi:pyruvate/2-oxoglutarate dehydrogenase complex dihydrolipoamide acyltransferase (E2) component